MDNNLSPHQQLDDIHHAHEDDYLKHEYGLAYYKTFFVPNQN